MFDNLCALHRHSTDESCGLFPHPEGGENPAVGFMISHLFEVGNILEFGSLVAGLLAGGAGGPLIPAESPAAGAHIKR
jgi:hypothetical protein